MSRYRTMLSLGAVVLVVELVGVFNDCAASAANGTASYCSVSGSTLRDVLRLQGKTHGYLLYLTILGYYGSGVTYVDASVLVREYVTDALWQSMTGGIISVTASMVDQAL